MANKLSGWDDTIVAVITPPGIGAIGVIRISGTRAIEIADQLFPSKSLAVQHSHTIHVGYLKDDDKILDEVVVSLYKTPASFTGEDVVEFSCHGSAYVQQQVLNAIIHKRARLAKAGEFTQRAFLNGKLDLTQAEAIADLIASNTEASKNAALSNMRGGFSEILKHLREELIRFSALIELELDFAEEDVEFADRTKLMELLNEISAETKKLLESFSLGNVIKQGVNVAIVGRPNAGKSTLLNTLLNENRAIVSEIAGTTRDTIEEVINISGILFRLIDTAGIRDHSADVIENMGVVKSRQKIKEADIVLYMFDVTSPDDTGMQMVAKELAGLNKKFFLVANKADMLDSGNSKYDLPGTHLISAKENKGIDELKQLLFSAATRGHSITEGVIVTNTRHYETLLHVAEALDAIQKGLSDKIPGDLLSSDIRQCLHYISEITGDISNEHILDYIFSKFCIGK